MIRSLKFSLLAVALTSTVFVSSCSSTVQPAPVSSTASNPSQREAGARGTEVCIENNSSMNLRIFWQGYPDTRAIPPGGRNCNSGYESHNTAYQRTDSAGNDLKDIGGRLEYEPTAYPGSWLSWNLVADNEMAASPLFALWFVSAKRSYGISQTMSVNGEESMQADWIAAKVTRVDDTESNKKFVLTITDDIRGQNHAKDVTNAVKGLPIIVD